VKVDARHFGNVLLECGREDDLVFFQSAHNSFFVKSSNCLVFKLKEYVFFLSILEPAVSLRVLMTSTLKQRFKCVLSFDVINAVSQVMLADLAQEYTFYRLWVFSKLFLDGSFTVCCVVQALQKRNLRLLGENENPEKSLVARPLISRFNQCFCMVFEVFNEACLQ